MFNDFRWLFSSVFCKQVISISQYNIDSLYLLTLVQTIFRQFFKYNSLTIINFFNKNVSYNIFLLKINESFTNSFEAFFQSSKKLICKF